MSRTLYADFPDEAYEALKSGEAVDNNGFRSKNGYYYPIQPSFREKRTIDEEMQEARARLKTEVTEFIALGIILPLAERFVREKVYPAIASAWDNWQEKRRLKKLKANGGAMGQDGETSIENDTDYETHNIINLADYQKRA